MKKKDNHKLNKVKTIQKLQEALEKKKYNRLAIVYSILFVITMLLEIAFLLWLNFNAITASRDAEDTSQVLQATYFRSYWLGLCNQETRYWLTIRIQWLMWDLEPEFEIINTIYSSLSRYNQQ